MAMDHESKVLNGKNINGNGTVPKARILFSARLTLAILCMFATWTFMFQRLTINFGLVCMVKTPTLNISLHSLSQNSSFLRQLVNNGSDKNDFDSFDNEISFTRLENVDINCPAMKLKNLTGINVTERFNEGEFEWSRDVQGLILASFYYGFFISQIPGGQFADRFGAKVGLIWSGLLLSLLTMLIPTASYFGPQYLMALRLLGGIANGAAMPAISSLSSRWFADVERGFMLGIAYAGFAIATAVAYPISAFFCEFTGWAYLFYFGGVIGLFWCLLTYLLVFEWPEVHPRISPKELEYIKRHRAVQYGGPTRQKVTIPWCQMLTSLPVWALLVANFCCFWMFLTIVTYIPTYLKEVLHLHISENGLISSIPFLSMMTFHFIVAVVFDKIRKRRLMSVTTLRKIFNTSGTLISAACTVLIGVLACDNVVGAIFLITAGQVFLEFAFMGGYIFSIFEMAPRYASALTAFMNTFGLVVGLLCPPFVSYMTPNGSREEWLLVFYISAGINAFGGIFYLLFGSAELQPWAMVGNNGKTSKSDTSSTLAFTNGSNGKGDKELKVLQIRLINGDSDVNGEIIRN